ncbi:unnamed protein product [Parnassius apollo]|uniref:(apollo) hypothetical protein n=1 Tax=Parnassius apollo TaxID=110799 RepID=A0A8S3W298_PARAO|nr:unnamed protein product [Parnassius apollo]
MEQYVLSGIGLAAIQEEAQQINFEPTPGPSTAPDSYARVAAAPITAPPSLPPPASRRKQSTERRTAKYPPLKRATTTLFPHCLYGVLIRCPLVERKKLKKAEKETRFPDGSDIGSNKSAQVRN